MPAWLHTIAKRRFADDARRRNHVLDGSGFDGLLDELAAPDDDGEVQWAVVEAISLLEPAQREIIAMRLLQGRSFCEIACSLEVTEAAAKMRFQRALGVLRTDLEQHGIAP